MDPGPSGLLHRIEHGLELARQRQRIEAACHPAIKAVGEQLAAQFLPKARLNGEILDTDKLYQALAERQNTVLFERKLAQAGYLVAASFFLSSVLNYILAKVILVSPPGTTAFNEELGRMTWLSYPVIVLPSMVMLFGAIIYMFRQISKLTGQSLEDFMLQ